MFKDTFYPISAELSFKSGTTLSLDGWRCFATGLLSDYTRIIAGDGRYVIGHIKALLELSDGSSIKLSCIKAGAGAESRCFGRGSGKEARMTLNSLVEAVSKTESLNALNVAARCQYWREIEMTIVSVSCGDQVRQGYPRSAGDCSVCEG